MTVVLAIQQHGHLAMLQCDAGMKAKAVQKTEVTKVIVKSGKQKVRTKGPPRKGQGQPD